LFVLDIILSVLVAVGLTELLVRAFRVRASWRRRWSAWLIVFLAAWGGGVWLMPGAAAEVGWVAYCLPFTLVGLVAIVVIAAASPLHRLTTAADREAFEREEQAVTVSVIVFFWSLCALLLAAVASGYWTR